MNTNAETWGTLAPWIGLALALLCLFIALRKGAQGRLIDDTPTSKTSGVFIGMVELKGTAEVETPLAGFLSERPCVHYCWTVEEHWSRTVVESYTDAQGHSGTRTRTETGWTKVGGETAQIPFYLRDDAGVLRVQPDRAKIEPATVFNITCGPNNSLYYQKGPPGAVADSTFSRRFVEVAIPLHAPVFVFGHAREREDMVAPEIAYDKQTSLFLISTRSEAQVSSGYHWAFVGLGLLGLVLAVAGTIVHNSMLPMPDDTVPFLAGGSYLVAWALGWIWMAYNSLVNLRERTRQAWANVDVQLKRRCELIPNLVSIVVGLRDYERNVQVEVTRLRAEMNATAPGEAGAENGAVSTTVIAIFERYPELKTNGAFNKLMDDLSDTEQRIALARGYFNDIATFYNTRLEKVPDRFIAALGAMKPQSLMAANDFARAPIVVKLAG